MIMISFMKYHGIHTHQDRADKLYMLDVHLVTSYFFKVLAGNLVDHPDCLHGQTKGHDYRLIP